MNYSNHQESENNKAVALAGADGFENQLKLNDTAATVGKQTTKKLKWKTTLAKLLEGKQHRFNAEVWGDHCLHTSVSDTRRERGVTFESEWVEVPTRFGTNCRVKRYWVAEASRQRALELLAAVAEPAGEGGVQ